MALKHRVIASFLASGWAALIGLAVVPLYLRFLGIEAYGLVGFFSVMQVWLSVLDFGLAATLNRELARFGGRGEGGRAARNLLRSIEGPYLLISLFILLVVVATAPWIAQHWLNAKHLPARTVAESVAMMGLVIAIQWMGTLYRNGLLGLHRQVWVAGSGAFTATARAASILAVLAWVDASVEAYFVCLGIVSCIETAGLRWYLARAMPAAAKPQAAASPLPNLRTLRQLAGGLPVLVLLGILLTQLDKLLLARLLSLEQFGYFMLMFSVANALAFVILPIYNVAFPRLSELTAVGEQSGLAQAYHKFAQLLSIAVWPPAMLLVAFAEEIILLWTRDAATTAAVAPLLRIWVFGTALHAMNHGPQMAQLSHGWTRLAILIGAIEVALMTGSLLSLVPHYGATAAAWIWVAVNALAILVAVPLMHKRILQREMWRWYLQDVALPLLSAIACAVILQWVFSLTGAIPPILKVAIAAPLLFMAVTASTQLGRHTLRDALARFRGTWATRT